MANIDKVKFLKKINLLRCLNKRQLRQVAKIANVSISTVSRVMNNNPRISEKTKEKVLRSGLSEISPKSYITLY